MSPLWAKRLTVMTEWMMRAATLSAAAFVLTIASHIDWRSADLKSDSGADRSEFQCVFFRS
jgi:hypothetical protein